MDSFTQFDYVFEYECKFSLIATLSSGMLAYSELFIFKRTLPKTVFLPKESIISDM